MQRVIAKRCEAEDCGRGIRWDGTKWVNISDGENHLCPSFDPVKHFSSPKKRSDSLMVPVDIIARLESIENKIDELLKFARVDRVVR